MKRFLFLLGIALAAIVPAAIFRFSGFRPNPVLDTAVFGVAVLAAGFMLSWGAEAAEKRISQGLVLALVALVTVLPEYAVDMYYAYQAGKAPESNYVHYAAANMTGANRLLVGVAWPLMAILHWSRTRERSIKLATVNVVEIGFLFVASLYAFVIVLRNSISLVDTVVLIGIFGAYLWVTGRMPKVESGLEADDEPGPAAALATLSPARQWSWMGGLTVVAAAVILASAEPFAESIVASGRVLGIDEFLLIQWLAPLASEAPAVVIAVLFVLSGRAGGRPDDDDQRQNQSVDVAGWHAAAGDERGGRCADVDAPGRASARGILPDRGAILVRCGIAAAPAFQPGVSDCPRSTVLGSAGGGLHFSGQCRARH